MPTFHVASQINDLFAYYKVILKVKLQRILLEIHVDNSLAWGYFNGACQGPDSINGIGFILYLLERHKFQVKGNIGRGTNNQGEFKALYYLLKSTLIRGIDKIHVMGDSSMVINWMKGSIQVKNNSLFPLTQQLKTISN